jgi:hypothetical protein
MTLEDFFYVKDMLKNGIYLLFEKGPPPGNLVKFAVEMMEYQEDPLI